MTTFQHTDSSTTRGTESLTSRGSIGGRPQRCHSTWPTTGFNCSPVNTSKRAADPSVGRTWTRAACSTQCRPSASAIVCSDPAKTRPTVPTLITQNTSPTHNDCPELTGGCGGGTGGCVPLGATCTRGLYSSPTAVACTVHLFTPANPDCTTPCAHTAYAHMSGLVCKPKHTQTGTHTFGDTNPPAFGRPSKNTLQLHSSGTHTLSPCSTLTRRPSTPLPTRVCRREHRGCRDCASAHDNCSVSAAHVADCHNACTRTKGTTRTPESTACGSVNGHGYSPGIPCRALQPALRNPESACLSPHPGTALQLLCRLRHLGLWCC